MVKDWGEGTDRGETLWSSQETWGYENRCATDSGAWVEAGAGSLSFSGYTDLTWYDVDITEIVQAWFAGSPNYGVLLKINATDDEQDSDAALEFFSRDQGFGYRPYMEITYTANTAPNSPTALSPTADALVNTLAPTLTASRSDPDVGDYISAYHAQVFIDSSIADSTTLFWDSGTITTTGTPITFSKVYSGPALTGNTYYRWRARTRDKGSLWGPWSGLNRFKVNTPPNPPSLGISEGPVSDLLTLNPTLNVTHSDNDATDTRMYGYRVILETQAGDAIWDSGDVDTSSAPLSTKSFVYSGPVLGWGGMYRFRARTRDSNGVWGNYSGNFLFQTHIAVKPTNMYPNVEIATSLTPTFVGTRGSSVDTITSYLIQVYDESQVNLIWDSGAQTAGISNGEAFSKLYTGSALSYGTTYKWRASITSTIGGTSPFSDWHSFSTPADATVPALALPTPNSNGRVTSLTPTFSGSRATTFTNYQIELYPEAATSSNLTGRIWDSGNISQSAATSFNRLYNGAALTWGTTYKWRARVGSPTLGNWTGLVAFSTDQAGAPILTSPANNAWITQSAPTFTGTSSGGDLMTAVNLRLYRDNVIIWDSGNISQSASTSFSILYSGPSLDTGVTYQWDARYVKSTGPTSAFSSKFTYRLNGPPYAPTFLEPIPGYGFSGTLLPKFSANFNDPDMSSHGDFPTAWVIEIRNNLTDAAVATKTINTSLVSGVNTYQWTSGDTGLAYNTQYKWRTWFIDSKGVAGAASSYQVFLLGQPPTVAVTSPSNGSNIATTKPTILWSYSDPAMSPLMKHRIRIFRESNGVQVYDSGERVSGVASFAVPTGYLQFNNEYYQIELRAWNSAGIQSNITTSTIQLTLAAPPAITGVSTTVMEDKSSIVIDWDKSSLGTAFVTYVIYRKEFGESEWSMVGTRKPETNTVFTDYYAGQRQLYQYRVTVVKLISGEPDVESPDSDIVTARLESDTWYVVGRDRAEEHIFELPVTDESHQRPVQQESFEPLGTNRKVVVRGFVLGHEGSVQCLWDGEETDIARSQIEYLLYYAGPHILKNPFGDVFDVTFGSPDFSYAGGGHLSVTLTYTEVGATSNPGITPEDYLQSIGAT
jgi:hypothetical protein